MLLTKTKLVSTAYRPGQYDPQPLYEVAVVGRSNAGKSSLINTICNNKKLARVSSAPGKTRSINFYEMDGALMLVDLPGYGFAKRSGICCCCAISATMPARAICKWRNGFCIIRFPIR